MNPIVVDLTEIEEIEDTEIKVRNNVASGKVLTQPPARSGKESAAPKAKEKTKAQSSTMAMKSSAEMPPTKTTTSSIASPPVVNVDDDDDFTVQLFRVNSKIVGKKHYNAPLNDGEIIYLVREPNNPYDRNAIMVQSHTRKQVGHISAGSSYPNMAQCLSQIVDCKLGSGGGGQLEAYSVSGQGAVYSSTCQITIIGNPQHRQAIREHLVKCRVGFLDLETGKITGDYADHSFRLAGMGKAPGAAAGTPSTATYETVSASDTLKLLENYWDNQDSSLEAMRFDPGLYPGFVQCFSRALFPHQMQGLAWMLDREAVKDILPPFYDRNPSGTGYIHQLTRHVYPAAPPRISGGILADAMGLGKTATLLALIVSNPPPGRTLGQAVASSSCLGTEAVLDSSGGAAKRKGSQDAAPEAKIRKTSSKSSAAATANKTVAPATAPMPTLVVCPLSVVSAWQDEIASSLFKDSVGCVLYHGPNRRSIAIEDLIAADIVITTYDVLQAEYSEREVIEGAGGGGAVKKKAARISTLQDIVWWRVVLDEAHLIRSMNTIRFKACNSLRSAHRWAVSGTLIVNKMDDLEATLRFLNVEPFSSDGSLFKRLISRPLLNGSHDAAVKIRTLLKSISIMRKKKDVSDHSLSPKIETIVRVEMAELERKAYDAIADAAKTFSTFLQMQSATQDAGNVGASILALITRLRQCTLDLRLVPARALVELMARVPGLSAGGSVSSSSDASTSALAKVALLSDEEKQNLISKLQSLMSAAVNGCASTSPAEDEGGEPLGAEDGESGILECCVCFDPLLLGNSSMLRNCQHILCKACMIKLFERANRIACPLCRAVASKDDVLDNAELQEALMSPGASQPGADLKPASSTSSTVSETAFCSAKTTEIIRLLGSITAANPSEKTVIFSSFTSYLDILEAALSERGLHLARVDGKCSQTKRASEIRRFSTDESVSVMLCSLKAAGVGITLTRANHVLLTDLWWAPSVDLQAIDRVHRLGQSRQVYVYRFMVKDSIDEKIHQLQHKKTELAAIATERRSASDERLERLRDMHSLLA